MAQQNQNKKKKSGGGFGALIAVLFFIVIPRLMDAADGMDMQRFFRRVDFWFRMHGIDEEKMIAIFIVVILVIVALITAAKRRKAGQIVTGRSAGRTSAAVRRPDPRTQSFSQPDPYCVVCDHSGEDHFVRDKAQRIAQLDNWLNTGLIDREEYRVLKDRFQRDL